ncbi:MAG: ferritin family protein [Phycisphaerales bacterium]|nr:MAG: ferritin family protein [Phycisphaerales bacterium]
MSKVNSNEEILEFSIAKEVEAYHFYMALAGRVDDPKIRQVFEDFADEELEHKAKLELEITKLGKTVSTELKPGRSGDGYVLIDGAAVLNMDYRDALLLAIQKEEAAFRIYVNLIGTVEDVQSHEVLLELAQQEVKHKLRFEAEYDALLKEA